MRSRLRFRGVDPLVAVANSPRLIMIILGGVICTGAVTYRLFEGGKISDGLWWTFVTGTTVGYGDISPKGIGQRIVAVLIMLTAILLTQLLTAHVTNRLVRDDNVFTHEEQEELKNLMREAITVLRGVRENMFTHEEQVEVMAELDRIRELLERTGEAGAPAGPSDRLPGQGTAVEP